MRILAATLLLCSLGLLAAGWADALPKPPPPPKYWSTSHCERVLHVQGDNRVVTAQGYGFIVGLRVCVGMGAPQACKWTADHRSRLYSRFLVFSRSRYVGGIVRSWTLATRGGAGLVAVRRHGGEAYVGWPGDFYTSPSSVKLLAPNASPARFRSIVAPLAARVRSRRTPRAARAGKYPGWWHARFPLVFQSARDSRLGSITASDSSCWVINANTPAPPEQTSLRAAPSMAEALTHGRA